jgi:hypothetical protein
MQSITPQNWSNLSTIAQLANVGAEVGRTISRRNNPSYGDPQFAFFRALELLDATIADLKNHNHRLVELCRTRELLVDWYTTNSYHSSDISWSKYFDPFGVAANIEHSVQGT